jgi:hypothetical protein
VRFVLAAYESNVPAAPVLALMAMGVIIAVGGHLLRSYRIVAMGLALVFLATALVLIGGYVAYRQGEKDPRPPDKYFSFIVPVDGVARSLG